jgi:hypothetical protein
LFTELLINIVTCKPISMQRVKYTHATIEKVLQELFSMWCAPCPLLGNRLLNTFPQNNRRSITRQQRDKKTLSTIQAVFSTGSMQSGYKRVEFWSWQLWKNGNEENENENENKNGASVRQSLIVSCSNWLWLREIVL